MEKQLKIAATEATGISLDIAGLGARSLAFIADFHLRFFLAIAWAVGSVALFNGLSLSDFSSDSVDFKGFEFLVMAIGANAIFLLYHPVLETIMRGRTPGKRFVGVRIVMNDGRAPTTGAVIIRNLFRVIDSAPALYVVGFVCGLFNARSLRLGDLAAGTVLVYDERLGKKDFDDIANEVNVAGLSVNDQAILMDLLNRWHRLAPDRRATFAKELLNRANVSVADIESKKLKVQGPLLRQRLLKLANTPASSARPEIQRADEQAA